MRIKTVLLLFIICFSILTAGAALPAETQSLTHQTNSICLKSSNFLAEAKISLESSDQTDSRNKDELIITLLTPQIQKAITDYYGENRRYEIGDSKIRIIERGEGQNWNIFKVEVKVDTFEGPHNDYFIETLVFRITPSTITLEDYQHSEFIPNKKS